MADNFDRLQEEIKLQNELRDLERSRRADERETTKLKEKQVTSDRARITAAREYQNALKIQEKLLEEELKLKEDLKYATGEDKKLLEEKAEKNRKEIKEQKKGIGILKKKHQGNEEILRVVGDRISAEEKSAAINYNINTSQEKSRSINEEIERIKADTTGLTEDEKKALIETLEKEKDILEINQETARAIQAEESSRKKLVSITGDLKENAKQTVAMAKAMVKTLMKNPWMAIGAALIGVVKLYEKMVNASKAYQESTGASLAQADDMTERMTTASSVVWNKFGPGLSHSAKLGYDSQKAVGAIVGEFGTMESVQKSTIKQMGVFEKGLNISMETSAKVMKQMEGLGAESQDAALNTMKFGAELAIANDVAPGAIMADIAANTESFAKYGNDGGKNMIRAAVAAKKLGMELGTLVKMSDSLLNFESSIQAEMEASMLIGKQLNYNKARELALSGDLEGATKSIMDQIGGAAEFQKMNVMQRQALADSIGVSADELAKMTSGKIEMKEPDKTSEEKLKKSMDESTLMTRNLLTADNALKVAMYVLVTAITLNTLAQGGFGKIMKGLGKGKGLLGKVLGKGKGALVSGIGMASGVASKGMGIARGVAGKGLGMASGVASKGMGIARGVAGKGLGLAKGIASSGKGMVKKVGANILKKVGGKTLAKGMAKGVGKSLLKKIPGVGLIAGLGFAAGRLMKGDGLGALAEVASGAASIIPGIGTAASVAIDAALIARDVSKASKDSVDMANKTSENLTKMERENIQKEKKNIDDKAKHQAAKKAAEQAAMKAAMDKKKKEEEKVRLEKQAELNKAAKEGKSIGGSNKADLEKQLALQRNNRAKLDSRKTGIEAGGVTGDEIRAYKTNERRIEMNTKAQEDILAALEKLNKTTENLKQD